MANISKRNRKLEKENSVTKLSSKGAVLGTYDVVVGRGPFAVVSDGTNAWVTNSGSNTVSKR